MSPPALPRFGRYSVLRPLAEGGMGALFVAYDPELERTVVLKRLGPRTSRELRARLQDEVAITRQLSHPHLVEYLAGGESQGELFLATGHVPGRDVHALCSRIWQEQRRVPLSIVLYVGLALCEALAYAHALSDLNFVHRDVTPTNVLLGFDGSLRLADHGLAKISTKGFRTLPGVAAGTLGFLSPEQLAAESVDRRTDIYGIGAVMWFMLTGRAPTDPLDAARSLVQQRRLAHFAPGLPDAIESILYRALAARREDRFTSADELGAALVKEGAVHDCDGMRDLIAVTFPGAAEREAEEIAALISIATRGAKRGLSRRGRTEGPAQRPRAHRALLLGVPLLVGGLFLLRGRDTNPTALAAADASMTENVSVTPPVESLSTPQNEAGTALRVPDSGRARALASSARDRRLLQAQTFAHRGMTTRAAALYDELEHDGAPASQVAIGRAELALALGDLDRAIGLSTEAVSHGGGIAARLLRARALVRAGRMNESARDYRAVLTHAPNNEEARRGLRAEVP